jgi:hypothetical protein
MSENALTFTLKVEDDSTVCDVASHERIRRYIGLYRTGLPTGTTAYSAPGAAVHGLMTVMPAARKGASSRVATLKRRDAAMAAIWASATAIE